jgi:hypothetical protein
MAHGWGVTRFHEHVCPCGRGGVQGLQACTAMSRSHAVSPGGDASGAADTHSRRDPPTCIGAQVGMARVGAKHFTAIKALPSLRAQEAAQKLAEARWQLVQLLGSEGGLRSTCCSWALCVAQMWHSSRSAHRLLGRAVSKLHLAEGSSSGRQQQPQQQQHARMFDQRRLV